MAGRSIAERIVASFPSCPIPEVARLGRTLRQWSEQFLAYFGPGGATKVAPRPPTASSSFTADSPAA